MSYFYAERLAAIESFNLAPAVIDGLINYVDLGIPPGDFLYSMLTNNLRQAVAHADDFNRTRIAEYVTVLYNYIPAQAWGSEENVREWMKMRQDNQEAHHEKETK